MSEEARGMAVFSCEYSEQNPVYCQQCGGHEHLCKKTLSDRWCEYANHLLVHGNDITALSMRTNLLAETNAHAEHASAIRTAAEAVIEPGTRLADIAPDGLTVSFDGSVEFGDGGVARKRGKGGCEYCGHELDETDPNPTTDGSPLICKECWRGETLNEPD